MESGIERKQKSERENCMHFIKWKKEERLRDDFWTGKKVTKQVAPVKKGTRCIRRTHHNGKIERQMDII